MALSFGQADLIGLAHRDLGNVAAESRDNRSAISHYRKAIAVYATLSDSSAVRGMASSLNNMGIVYKNMGLLDSALAMDRRALAMSMSVGDRTGMMYAYASIARVFEIQGNNDSALFYYERNGTIAEELGDRHTLGGSYGNHGPDRTGH
jgi:tetratricopeptide (TPR) repeat protein